MASFVEVLLDLQANAEKQAKEGASAADQHYWRGVDQGYRDALDLFGSTRARDREQVVLETKLALTNRGIDQLMVIQDQSEDEGRDGLWRVGGGRPHHPMGVGSTELGALRDAVLTAIDEASQQ